MSDKISDTAAELLRQQAEQRASASGNPVPENAAAPSAEEMRQSLHELRVHQIELEMQNEELRRAQVELDTTRARYVDLYDHAPVGYCTLSETGLIVEANLTAAALMGMNRGALVMQPISRFILKDDQDSYYRVRKQSLATGELQTCELRMLRDDGTSFWSHLAVTVAQDSIGGQVMRVVLSDVSERVLLQQQSVHAQKMQAIGQFTSGIAHDFNNILASILGYTELALERVTPEQDGKLANYLNEVKQANARALELIANLLAFSRGGKGKNSAQTVAAGPLIAEIAKLLRPLLPSSMDIVLMIEPELPNLTIDPAHLHQMVMNLSINARDALGESGVIEIGLAKRAALNAVCASCHQAVQGEFVELWTRDAGCGIAPEALVHIFEPFYSTKALGKGTGLGLSIVHGLVHGYGGHIIVASAPGVGTTVRVLLPATENIQA